MVKVAIVEGDGIGHEVIPVARDILAALRPDFEFFDVEVGYGVWERTGCACGEEAMADLRSADVILFGAITTPPDPDYRSILLQIRHDFDLYANVRPIQGGDVDIVIVRENTEGLYSGIEWAEADRACTVRVVTRQGSERIARYACTLARSRRHLTIGNKANVLKSDCLFVDVCMAEAARADVPCKACYIDALCLDVLMHPDRYDVIVRRTSSATSSLTPQPTWSGGSACSRARISGSGMPFLSLCMGAPRILPGGTWQTP